MHLSLSSIPTSTLGFSLEPSCKLLNGSQDILPILLGTLDESPVT